MTTSSCLPQWSIILSLSHSQWAPLIYFYIFCSDRANEASQKQLHFISALSVSVWFDAISLMQSVNPPPPQSRNEISAIGKTDVKAALQQVENELEKCFWQASLTYYRVTFGYQIDSSRSWHWTSVLLITLLWVGSADRREPHHDRPIHSDRETRSTDRPPCIRKVTSLTPGSTGVSYAPLNS